MDEDKLTTNERLERTIKHLAHTIRLLEELVGVVEMMQTSMTIMDGRLEEVETRLTMRS